MNEELDPTARPASDARSCGSRASDGLEINPDSSHFMPWATLKRVWQKHLKPSEPLTLKAKKCSAIKARGTGYGDASVLTSRGGFRNWARGSARTRLSRSCAWPRKARSSS